MDKLFRSVTEYKLSSDDSKGSVDWWAFLSVVPLTLAGLVTMNSLTGESSFATQQLIWFIISIIAFFTLSHIDVRAIRSSWMSITLFAIAFLSLFVLSVIGKVTNGAESWFHFGILSFQPGDFAKLALIVVLSKYFSRRHIEIANIKHIFISGAYAFLLFALVVAQPDMGSAMIIAFIWLGMVIVSGISKKHLFSMIGIALLAFILLWNFGFHEYQKDRIRNFLNPFADIHGAGYNAYQSTVAVGSGQLFGKGLGYGTQSRLKFLPEYQTDFVFAAFAEEWGFVGVLIVFSLYGILIWRIIRISMRGATNFEILFGAGVAIYFIVHIGVNVGMNIHLLPVTGTPLPFMSYGGTHLLSEFVALGVLMSMRKYSRIAHRDMVTSDILNMKA